MAIFVNFVAFQIGWFSVVLSAAAGQPWAGTLIVAAIVALHLYCSEKGRDELALLATCGVIGGVWDSLLVGFGWVAYPAGMILPFLAPYWIVAMWISFATTLNASLAWLKGRTALAVTFGAAGGPLAYLTGEKLGAIELVDPLAAYVALGAGWAVMMPLLLKLADRFDGFAARRGPGQDWILD